MKEINNNYIEQALAMHKETVSPHTNCLQEILSHIPEKKIIESRRAVRSPYTWLAITQVVTFCLVVVALIPNVLVNDSDGALAYAKETEAIDTQIEAFELSIDEQDYNNSLLDSASL